MVSSYFCFVCWNEQSMKTCHTNNLYFRLTLNTLYHCTILANSIYLIIHKYRNNIFIFTLYLTTMGSFLYEIINFVLVLRLWSISTPNVQWIFCIFHKINECIFIKQGWRIACFSCVYTNAPTPLQQYWLPRTKFSWLSCHKRHWKIWKTMDISLHCQYMNNTDLTLFYAGVGARLAGIIMNGVYCVWKLNCALTG